MKFLKYRKILHQNCHWVILLCYYLGLIKITEIDKEYKITIRFYHPLILLYSFFYYIYFLIKGIINVFKELIISIYNDFTDPSDYHLTIMLKNKNEKK